jgi:hypothetical protein
MIKLFKVFGIACASVVALAVIALFVIGSIGPDTSVYTGRQVPKRFMKTIRSLNLLSEGEQIKYFYSDALVDIKKGLYLVTDRNLVLYSTDWEEPETIIPFDRIKSLDVEYNDSFWDDSMVNVTTYSGMEVYFPVSSEKGLDRKFVQAIGKNLNDGAGALQGPAAEGL